MSTWLFQAMEMLPDLLSAVCSVTPEAETSGRALQVASQLIRQSESPSGRALGPVVPSLLQESFRRHPKVPPSFPHGLFTPLSAP